ncbi:hypothetical protein V6N13_058274 [Hibiscus sabdariffa]|uniref:Uncharacterized protein n=1 Tax=Hibiscus sabdariffa TaxID=183260 RepID=A0ABR2GGX2_9ROSI
MSSTQKDAPELAPQGIPFRPGMCYNSDACYIVPDVASNFFLPEAKHCKWRCQEHDCSKLGSDRSWHGILREATVKFCKFPIFLS